MSIELSASFLDLDKIAESGQCFRWQRIDNHCYRIPHVNECLTIRQLAHDRFSLDCTESVYDAIWKSYFDLDTDYEVIPFSRQNNRDDDQNEFAHFNNTIKAREIEIDVDFLSL